MDAESWKRFTTAIDFYTERDFKFVDVNWTVPALYSDITKPKHLPNIAFDPNYSDEVLVGSAEQSFLELYYTDKLKEHGLPELYFGITPCFRWEPAPDRLHKKYFLKLELFSSEPRYLKYLIECAQEFYQKYVGCSVIKTDEAEKSYDIISYQGIELGSYMIRNHAMKSWACGTGLAEPRLSIAIEKL